MEVALFRSRVAGPSCEALWLSADILGAIVPEATEQRPPQLGKLGRRLGWEAWEACPRLLYPADDTATR